MPGRDFIERSTPLPIHDRLRLDPAAVVTPLWSVLAGFGGVWTAHLDMVNVSESINHSPGWLGWSIGITLMLGGFLCLLGIAYPWDRLKTQWALERSGWTLLAFGWLVFAVLVAFEFPSSAMSWGSYLAIAVISAARWTMVAKSQAITIHATRKERERQ